jgi:hypothetical protein
MAVVAKIQEPLIPIKRPKQIQEKKLKKGKTKMQKYIKINIFSRKPIRLNATKRKVIKMVVKNIRN